MQLLIPNSNHFFTTFRTQVYNRVERVIFCSGKFFYELVELREKNTAYKENTAIIRIEEFSPFPVDHIAAELGTI